MRRVVAGGLTDGSSGIVSDSASSVTYDYESIPGLSDTLVWVVSRSLADDPLTDITPTVQHAVPHGGEVFVRVVRIPPDAIFASADFDESRAAEEFAQVMGDADIEHGEDGFHRTPSSDLLVVVTGRLTLVMANGDRAQLVAGDVVIQVAGMHRWRNESDEPAEIFIVHVPPA